MAMERVRSSLAALLFLTLVLLLAASASGSGVGDDAAAAVDEVEKQKQCHPRADEPYMLVAFHNKADGEEIRLLADQRTDLLSGVTGFANRSGHWFYSPVRARREEGSKGGSGRRRRLDVDPRPTQPQSNNRFGAEGLWNTLGVLVNATATATNDDDSVKAGYMLVGVETSGGDKNRLVVVADQSYFFITGVAQGFSSRPRWFFREGERHRLLPLGGGNGSSSSSSSSSSHAEVVASSVLATLMNAGRSCG